ncbi:FadR family transcriptional regulator [Arthrobacter sp. C9C5]|nr:FCD domain-containing protein [Arthrobacter sp. C9C5]NUU33035.1 FadR family transcriptional regulator [Arthrobacter sp. C9C5]
MGAQARLRALQADIIELILERELGPGDPLPTENELAPLLGIGRNTLRETLKVLQALGVIEIRHGFGMFVAGSNFEALVGGLSFRARMSLRHRGREALELIEARRLLESGLIGASMARMTADHLAGLEAAVLRTEELARSGEHFVEADADFHRKLFEPLGNELLLGLVDAFQTVYRRIQLELGGDGRPLTAEVRADVGSASAGTADTAGVRPAVDTADLDPAAGAALHRGIYEAVAAGDAVLAAERLGSHFDGMRRRIAAAVGE